MKYQAWQLGPPGKIVLHDIEEPLLPGPNEVLVRIHAVSLNYRDKLVIDQDPNYPVESKPHLVPCSDGAGVVEDAGPNSVWKKGDKVIIHSNSWKTGSNAHDFKMEKALGGGNMDGTLRNWMIVSDDDVFRAPNGFSLEEASTLYTAGVTAYRALFYGGLELKPGMKLLTQGTGGVSCYAIMIGAAVGATVVATSSSDEKLRIAQKLGATHLINYRRNPDWESEVLEVTNSQGVDITVDVVGAQSIKQTLKATAYDGLVCLVGMLSQDPNLPVDIMSSLLFGSKTSKSSAY